MKKIFIALLAAGCLVACTSKKTAYEQYTELYDNVVAQLETVEDRAAKDSIIDNFVTKGYTLLLENVQDVTSDSIVLNIFYMLSPEQKAEHARNNVFREREAAVQMPDKLPDGEVDIQQLPEPVL